MRIKIVINLLLITALLWSLISHASQTLDAGSSKNDVRKVIKLYTQGAYEDNAEKLNASFHEKAVMNGYLAGQLMLTTPEPCIEKMCVG